MAAPKRYISADELLLDSFRLGVSIYNSGFRPDFIVGVWRGGTPVGVAVQEILAYLGNETDHIAIRTSSYEGIEAQRDNVRVYTLSYLVRTINAEDSLLVIDDVFDSGRSICAIIETLEKKSRKNCPQDIRVAVPWYKPNNNKTNRVPDYFLHQTDEWLVFPHELEGLSQQEIFEHKPGLKEVLQAVKPA